MARLRRFEVGKQNVHVHRTEVDCYHQTLAGPHGATYLHLSTFGSESRQSAPKSSQSLQLDREMAQELVDIIRQTFPGVR